VTPVQEVERIVTFRLGADLFAADIFSVERVLRYEAPRAIPDVPEWIEGVLEHEGRVVPVIDLRRRFGLPRAEPAPQTRLLVLSSGDDLVAAVVDAVLDVRPLDVTDLAPPPELFRGLAGRYLRGLTRRDGELVVLLDVGNLLSSRERLTLKTAGTRGTHA
jgi:purine-binding chemotaxis protein CheW